MAKSVVITGASDGIGKSLAYSFAKRGFALGLVARRSELLEKVAQTCREMGAPEVHWQSVDVSKYELQRKALQEFEDRFKGIDIFIANAGIGIACHPHRDRWSVGEPILQVNALAAINSLEWMKEKMTTRGHGHLVGVTSVASAKGNPRVGFYCASKAALHAYMESLTCDLFGSGVDVSTVAPGFIDTAMTQQNKFYMPFLMKSDVAGEIFAKKILDKKRMIIAPWSYSILFWALKAMPYWLYFGVVNFRSKLRARAAD